MIDDAVGEPPYEGSLRWFREVQWWAWALAVVCADAYSRSRYGNTATNYALGFLLGSLALSMGGLRLLQIRFKGMRRQFWVHGVLWMAIIIIADSFAIPEYRHLVYAVLPSVCPVERFFDDVHEYGNQIQFYGVWTFILCGFIRWINRTINALCARKKTNS